jgi:hypothetical protein
MAKRKESPLPVELTDHQVLERAARIITNSTLSAWALGGIPPKEWETLVAERSIALKVIAGELARLEDPGVEEEPVAPDATPVAEEPAPCVEECEAEPPPLAEPEPVPTPMVSTVGYSSYESAVEAARRMSVEDTLETIMAYAEPGPEPLPEEAEEGTPLSAAEEASDVVSSIMAKYGL